MPDLKIAVRDNTRRGVASAARNLTTLKDKAQAAARSMRGLGGQTQKTGVQFAQSAMKMAGFSMALGSVGLVMRSVIKSGADFEFTMARVGAVTGATGKSFDALNKQAKELGASTVFSAGEAAEAMQALGMAGMEADEIMSVMPTTLQLAAAGAMDLGQTADIVTNILSGMRMEVTALDGVANGLAVAATSSNTSISLLGESFSYVSGIAATVGLEFADVTAALGKLGDAGLKGSRAGMNLSMAMAKVVDPSRDAAEVMERLELSFMKADGTMVDLVDMVQQLEKAQISAADQFKLFGVQGGRAISALVGAGAPALEKLRTSIETNNTALDEMSDRMGDTMQNKMKALTSAVEGLQLEMYENLAPALTVMVEQLTLVARSDEAVQTMKDLGSAAGELAKVLIEIGKFVREYGDELLLLASVLGAGKAGSLLAKGATMVGATAVAAPVAAGTLAVGASVAGASYARSKVDPFVGESGAGNLFDALSGAISDSWKGFWDSAPKGAFGTSTGTGKEKAPRWGLDLDAEKNKDQLDFLRQASFGAFGDPGAVRSVADAAGAAPGGGDGAVAGPTQGVLDYNEAIRLQIEAMTQATPMATLLAEQELALFKARKEETPEHEIAGIKQLQTAERGLLSARLEADAQAKFTADLERDQIELDRKAAAETSILNELDGRKLELAVAMAQGEGERAIAEEALLRHQLKGKKITGDLADEFVALNKQMDKTKDITPDTTTIADGTIEVSNATKEAIDKFSQLGNMIGQSVPEVDALMGVMQGFLTGGPLGGAIAGFTGLISIMEKGQMTVAEFSAAIDEMLNSGAGGTKDAMELLYGGGEAKAAQERMFAPLLEFYNSLEAGSGPERVKNFFAAMASFDFNDKDVYDISKNNPFTKIIDEVFSDGTGTNKSVRDARNTFQNLMREAFGGEMSFVDLGMEMVETGDAFEGLRESAAAAKDAVNGLSDAEDRHTRLVYDQQEIAARGDLSLAIKEAGGDVFEQRRIYEEFQALIASIKRSETLARSRGGAGTPAAAGGTGGTGADTVVTTPAGDAVTLSPIAPTNWNTIVDEDALRAATPIPVIWSEILALLGRSHTRIGNGPVDDLSHWNVVVDTGKLRGMTKIDMRWSGILDLLDNEEAPIDDLKSWSQVIDVDALKGMTKISKSWGQAISMDTKIGAPGYMGTRSLTKWEEIVDKDVFTGMTKIRVKWSSVLDLLGAAHTRIGNPDANDTLNKWELVVDTTNLKGMEKIDISWSDILAPTKMDLSPKDAVNVLGGDQAIGNKINFTADLSGNQSWAVAKGDIKAGVTAGLQSVRNMAHVSINLAELIDFDTADLSDTISRKVQEAIDDRQIETIDPGYGWHGPMATG
jgi:TP901 family phage tail tape measure protein